MKNSFKLTPVALALCGVLLTLTGCATDENPITPEKMSELRKQEGDQRANFNPGAQPKGP
jgi:hypothetical protein